MQGPPSREYDVVVVGASTSGLHAAHALARAGASVVVLERKSDPSLPGRTWIVTPEIRRFLPDLPPEVVVHETAVMEMFAGVSRSSVGLHRPDLIIERRRLLEYLRMRAASAGATVLTGHDVRGLRREEEGWVVSVDRRDTGDPRRFASRHLIDAGGVQAPLGRHLGQSPQPAAPVIQARVRLSEGHDPAVTRIWFQRETTPYFLWLIPDSTSHGVLGLVNARREDARRILDGFLARSGVMAEGRYEGAMIPLHSAGRRIAWRSGGNRVLQVGDAAGHVKVTTVGGVVTGLWGAEAAARALLSGTSYRRELRALRRELRLHDLIRWVMDRFDQRAYVRMLGLLNDPLAGILARRNRDSMAGAVLPLLVAQPEILALAVRSLVRPYRAGVTRMGDGSYPALPLLRPEAVEGD